MQRQKLSLLQRLELVKWLRAHDSEFAAKRPTREKIAEKASEDLGFHVGKGSICHMIDKGQLGLRYTNSRGGRKTPPTLPISKDYGSLVRNLKTITHIVASLAKDCGADTQAEEAFQLLAKMKEGH